MTMFSSHTLTPGSLAADAVSTVPPGATDARRNSNAAASAMTQKMLRSRWEGPIAFIGSLLPGLREHVVHVKSGRPHCSLVRRSGVFMSGRPYRDSDPKFLPPIARRITLKFLQPF